LLLLLPHHQIVFTFPRVLRVFFRNDRRLDGEISKLVYRIIQRFCNEAAGRRIQDAAMIVYASAGGLTPGQEHAGSVLYQSEYNAYFRTNSRLFPATEFLVEVLQHLPDAGSRGLAERPPAAARGAPRPSLRARSGSVHVRHEVPLRPLVDSRFARNGERLGLTARKGL
jgi:hypothetical protein